VVKLRLLTLLWLPKSTAMISTICRWFLTTPGLV
jgi:hypothetical protein